jgi:hypothetical protein
MGWDEKSSKFSLDQTIIGYAGRWVIPIHILISLFLSFFRIWWILRWGKANEWNEGEKCKKWGLWNRKFGRVCSWERMWGGSFCQRCWKGRKLGFGGEAEVEVVWWYCRTYFTCYFAFPFFLSITVFPFRLFLFLVVLFIAVEMLMLFIFREQHFLRHKPK